MQTSIQSLTNLSHLGAVAADGLSGDGCGLLFKTPDAFFRKQARNNNITLNKTYAVGLIFLNIDPEMRQHSEKVLKNHLADQGLTLTWLRDVPINTEFLGKQAQQTLPCIKQVFVNADDAMPVDEFDRKLFMARSFARKELETTDPSYYISTLSPYVTSYKANDTEV